MIVTKNHLSVVAADRQEVRGAEALQRLRDVPERLGRPRRIRAGGAENRAPVEVDPRERGDLELLDMAEVPLHEPLVAVVATKHAEPAVARLDRGRRDHSVDAGRRSAADEDGEGFRAHVALRSSSGVYAPDRAVLLQRARWRNARWASPTRAGSPAHVLSGAAWSARA